MVKITQDKCFIWLFLISTCLDGIIWEAFGWGAVILIYIMYKKESSILSVRKNKLYFCFPLAAVMAYVITQICILNLNLAQSIRLYGITKTVITFLIVYLLLGEYIKDHDVLQDILPLLLLINWISAVYIVTGNERFNIIGGSRNYLGAIDVVIIPYILKFMPKEKKKTKIFWISTILLLALFSGSRTLLVASLVAICFTILLEGNLTKKLQYLVMAMAAVLILLMLAPVMGNNDNFSRAMSIFTSLADQARSDLADSALVQYQGYSEIQKLIGNGNNLVTWREAPPHNFIYELLLCYGKIGVIAFLTAVGGVVSAILVSRNKNKKYAVLVIFLALIVGLVQPFITSGFLFQIVAAMSCFTLLKLGNDRNNEIKL